MKIKEQISMRATTAITTTLIKSHMYNEEKRSIYYEFSQEIVGVCVRERERYYKGIRK